MNLNLKINKYKLNKIKKLNKIHYLIYRLIRN